MGLRIPVGVNNKGRANVETDATEQTKKILFLAFSENEDRNPFQNVGFTRGLIFQIINPALRAKASREIEQVLARLSERVELAPDTVIGFENKNNGEVEMSFKYVDLFTNKVEEFRKTFIR